MSSATATDSTSTDATAKNKNAAADTSTETNNNTTAAVASSSTIATIPKDTTDAASPSSSSSKKQTRFFEIMSSGGSVGSGDGEKKDAAAAAAAASSSEAKDATTTTSTTGTAPQRRLSQSELAISAAPTSVTQDRKKELLEQARADRLHWIRHVPLPYQGAAAAAAAASNASNSSPWKQNEHLQKLENSHAVRQCPSALAVLSHLYGIPNQDNKNDESSNSGSTVKEIGDRVANIIAKTQEEYDENNNNKDKSSNLAVPTAEQRREAELSQATTDADNTNTQGYDDPDVLQAYHEFVTHLSDPVCAMLVQGMRSFCRNLTFVQEKEQVALKLQAYLDSTMEAIQGHSSWRKSISDASTMSSGSTATMTLEGREWIRRSLDSFIYGQCHDHIRSLYWTEDAKTKEQEWLERIDSLQFVTPRHLEIAGLEDMEENTTSLGGGGDENNSNINDSVIRDLLQDPIHALLSIHRYHAPFEKLQRILAVYRGVNAALSTALNQQSRNDNESDKARRLPSADDVLPTIILTVLRARPEGLLVNLQVVEDFCLPAHLRAEAGYALTTLYGAVQFVQDFDLKEPTSHLAIDADEFRAGLDKCRKVMEGKLAATKAAAAAAVAASSTPMAVEVTPTEVHDISVREVRSARLRGEVIDMDWAMRWQAQHGEETVASGAAVTANMSTDELLTEGLPQGFSRNYSFLSTRPEDVRMSDLPRLLSEYKMLVQATESLLAERLAKHAAERKAQRLARQKELYARARELDPSLIPSSSSNKNNTTGTGGGSSSSVPNDSIDKTD